MDGNIILSHNFPLKLSGYCRWGKTFSHVSGYCFPLEHPLILKRVIFYGNKLNLNVKVKDNDTGLSAFTFLVVRHIIPYRLVTNLSYSVERF